MTLDYATTDEDAAERAAEWQDIDPFPKIAPALLNAADVRDYVAATGMLFPFHDRTDKLKRASYEVDLLGTYVYFDEQGQRHSDEIRRGQDFVLSKNSIAFVTLEPTFRVPNYLALRFNLRIKHVYRGLLLGTGPLVDPGFTGRLSIPLHNLTTNDYTLKGGEGLIWVEFTKLSPLPSVPGKRSFPRKTRQSLDLPMPTFPDDKKGKDVAYYLGHAEPNRAVRSGIPQATAEASSAALRAREETAVFRRRLDVGTVLGLAGIVALLLSFWTLLNDVNTRVDNVPPVVNERVEELKSRVARLEEQLTRQDSSAPSSVAPEPQHGSSPSSTPSRATPGG